MDSVIDGLKSTERVKLKSAAGLFALALIGIVFQIDSLITIIATLGPFALLFVEALARGHNLKLRRRQQKEDARKLIQSLGNIIEDNLGLEADEYEVESDDSIIKDITTTTSLSEPFVFRFIFRNKLLRANDGYKPNTILILALCKVVEESSGSKKIKAARESIQIIFTERYDFDENLADIGQEEKDFLKSYAKYKDDEPITSDSELLVDKKDLYEEFLNTYLPQTYANSKLNLLKTQENIDVKEVLTKIFRKDELYLKNVKEDMRRRIEDEMDKLEEETSESSGYLVFSKQVFGRNYHKDLLEERFPDNWYVGTWEEFPVSCHVIYPGMTYKDAADILENEILPLARKKNALEEGSQIFVVSLETHDYEAYPEEGSSEPPKYYQENLSKIKFLSRGYPNKMELVIDSMIGIKISTQELLASLPINAFIDDELEEDKRIALSEIYPELTSESYLNISEIFDWARREPNRIKEAIEELDEEDRFSEDEVQDITERISEKSAKLDRAIGSN